MKSDDIYILPIRTPQQAAPTGNKRHQRNDEYCRQRWDLTWSLLRRQEARNLWVTVGPAKRFSLLLGPEQVRDSMILEFRRDVHYSDVCEMQLGVQNWYTTTQGRRNIYKRLWILQHALCFKEENWKWTPRTCLGPTRETTLLGVQTILAFMMLYLPT